MEIIKKHIISILCIVSVVLLALPLATVVVNVESAYLPSINSESAITGFSALGNSIFAYVLIIGPAILIIMNYVKQLEKYKGVLAIIVPIVCIISLIIVLLTAKSFSPSASANEYASAEVDLKVGIGAILLLISYIATVVAGAVTYHSFTLDKAGIDKLKAEATGLIDATQNKISGVIQDISNHSETPNRTSEHQNRTALSNPIAISVPLHKKPNNLNRIDEILSLIERLAQMKDAGVLTEEEFLNKKQKLLEEIQ